MATKFRVLVGLGVVALATAACGAQPQSTPTPSAPGLPNPASVFCEEQGGRLEIRDDASGGQVGICIFVDGSECDEWAFFRGECQPGGGSEPSPTAVPTQVAEPTATPPEGWEIYTHPTMGYTFFYPAGSTLETDDTGSYITVVGPLENNEHWPWFNVAHPDREDYRPPADADLRTWLADHNLLSGEVQAARTIADVEAVHIRQESGPQAYDADRFYFVHAGQMYEITILHAGKEDWSVYDTFLNSFHF